MEVICCNDYTISGRVTVPGSGPIPLNVRPVGNEQGIEGVTVRLTGAEERETVTDENGFFLFEHLKNGNYWVSFHKPSYFFSPEPVSVDLLSRDASPIILETFNLLGDLNGDSVVTLSDAILALQVLCGMDIQDDIYPGASLKGKFALEDVIYIMQEVGGLREAVQQLGKQGADVEK